MCVFSIALVSRTKGFKIATLWLASLTLFFEVTVFLQMTSWTHLLWKKEVLDTEKESNHPGPRLRTAAYCSLIPERVSKSITKTKIKVFWPYCGMFPSVMQLLSRCAEAGWVSKHTAQQIGKEEHGNKALLLCTSLTPLTSDRENIPTEKKRKDGETVESKRREM